MSTPPHYKPGVYRVSDLLKLAGYYDYPYQRETERTTRGYWLSEEEFKAFCFKRGHWVNDVCDLIAQGLSPLAVAAEQQRTLIAIQANQPDWEIASWQGFVAAYENWRLLYPAAKLIGVQGYVHHPALGYQGTWDQLWQLPNRPDDRPSPIATLIDLKCVADGAHCPKATALQLAAYAMALPEKYIGCHRLGLALHADGTFIEDHYDDYHEYAAARLLAQYWTTHGEGGVYR